MHKLILTLPLIAVTACSHEEPVAQETLAESKVEQTTAAQPEQRSDRTDDADGEVPQLHDKPDSSEPTNYLEQARALADQQLSTAQERCVTLAAHLEDNCITSANVQHEAAMANARVEYERQLADQAEELSE